MPTYKIAEAIDQVHSYQQTQAEALIKQTFNLAFFKPRLLALENQLSDAIDVNLFGSSYWFTITNREDLPILLTLAPTWRKSQDCLGIKYSAEVDNVAIHIMTRDAALPPTCRVVKKLVTVPEHTEERSVVECDKPLSDVVEDTPEAVTADALQPAEASAT